MVLRSPVKQALSGLFSDIGVAWPCTINIAVADLVESLDYSILKTLKFGESALELMKGTVAELQE